MVYTADLTAAVLHRVALIDYLSLCKASESKRKTRRHKAYRGKFVDSCSLEMCNFTAGVLERGDVT